MSSHRYLLLVRIPHSFLDNDDKSTTTTIQSSSWLRPFHSSIIVFIQMCCVVFIICSISSGFFKESESAFLISHVFIKSAAMERDYMSECFYSCFFSVVFVKVSSSIISYSFSMGSVIIVLFLEMQTCCTYMYVKRNPQDNSFHDCLLFFAGL